MFRYLWLGSRECTARSLSLVVNLSRVVDDKAIYPYDAFASLGRLKDCQNVLPHLRLITFRVHFSNTRAHRISWRTEVRSEVVALLEEETVVLRIISKSNEPLLDCDGMEGRD